MELASTLCSVDWGDCFRAAAALQICGSHGADAETAAPPALRSSPHPMPLDQGPEPARGNTRASGSQPTWISRHAGSGSPVSASWRHGIGSTERSAGTERALQEAGGGFAPGTNQPPFSLRQTVLHTSPTLHSNNMFNKGWGLRVVGAPQRRALGPAEHQSSLPRSPPMYRPTHNCPRQLNAADSSRRFHARLPSETVM